MIKAFSSSLSLRLLGIFLITAVLVIVLLVSLFSRGLSGQWRRTIQPHLVQYLHYVQQDLGNPPKIESALALAERLPVDIYVYQKQQFLYSTTGEALQRDKIAFRPVTRAFVKNPKQKEYLDNYKVFVSMQRSPRDRILRIDSDDHSVYYNFHETRGVVNQHARYAGFNDELIIALLLLSVLLVASYLMIRRQLSPIRQIQASVSRMANAELDHRISRQGNSDLDVLAQSIDGMAERLQALLDAKRQLLISISHELRSPLTRARLNTEMLPDSRQRERLVEDLQDMQTMITDIMESEQLQNNHAALNIETVNLTDVFLHELQAFQLQATINTNLRHETAIYYDGDVMRLKILFRNLLSNAVHHGKEGQATAKVAVNLTADDTTIELMVNDEGPGIAEAHLQVIADPFYRPDPSRSRATGGFGLGLTLAKRIAEAHGGTLTIDSRPNELPGTRISVVLPRDHENETL